MTISRNNYDISLILVDISRIRDHISQIRILDMYISRILEFLICIYQKFQNSWYVHIANSELNSTRRPASADRTARRQFQATSQTVSRTQASDAMTSRLPRYEAKCVQRRCFQCGSVHLRSGIKGTKLPPANILIPLERQLIALQLCRWEFLYNETLQQIFRPLLSKLSKRQQI